MTHPSPEADTLSVRGPVELITAVPYLLGFVPERSLVLVAMQDTALIVTVRIDLADCDTVKTLEKHKSRLMLLDYKDANKAGGTKITETVFDYGDGVIDFPGCHRVLKSINFKGWLCADLDVARQGPRKSYERCADYVVNKLEPIYV